MPDPIRLELTGLDSLADGTRLAHGRLVGTTDHRVDLTLDRDDWDALEEALTRADELQQLFDLQWTRMQEATALWRAEAPAERELTMPDLGALLTWLMERIATAEAERDQAIAHDRQPYPTADAYEKAAAQVAAGIARHRAACAIAGIEPEPHDADLWASLDEIRVPIGDREATVSELLADGTWRAEP